MNKLHYAIHYFIWVFVCVLNMIYPYHAEILQQIGNLCLVLNELFVYLPSSFYDVADITILKNNKNGPHPNG